MKSIKSCFNTFLTLLLACQMALLPLTVGAAPLTPDGTTNTTVTSAQNGVPVVNIANPSASGLSHNKFTDYNVNANGLILNNTPNTTVQTQLGGFILGNPAMTNSASAILNEVTSTNRSALNGYTEVAGPRTDLIIANPNGLTINGAGFINTGNLTLTTGNPNVVNGSLNSLNVNGGDITINGTGLDTLSQDSTSIYTQGLNLNAKLHAKNLDVKLGNNTVSYPTGTITASAPTSTPTGLLLDSSALGGMYADRITLVGTGAGLGVKLPPEVLASVGDINITNDGTITLKKTSAGGNVNVNSANGGVSVTDTLYSSGSATLTAGTNLTVNAGVVAGAKASMNINANQLKNAGTLVAGLNADKTLNATGSMNVTAPTITNDGAIQSTGNLNVSGSTTITNNGMFNAGNNLTVWTTDLTNNMTLFASNNMNLYTSGTLNNNPNANILAMNNMTLAADAVGGKTTSIINDQANIEAYLGNLAINAVTLTNRTTPPVVQGSYAPTAVVGGINLSTTTVSNTCAGTNCRNDVTTSVDAMVLTSSSAPATIHAGGNATINATNINNNYSLISAGGNITLAAQVVDNIPVDIVQVTTVSTAMYRNSRVCGGFDGWGFCIGGWSNQMVYVGTSISPTAVVTNSVASTIQAGGSITGTTAALTNANLANVNISQNQVIAPSAANSAGMAITPPTGPNGLFVLNSNPQSTFLIETNPAFAVYANFISSGYLLGKLNVAPTLTTKRLGDAFYENKLIRDSIFAQTGRRYLASVLRDDNAQYQYLMDNALAAHEDLQLIPGVALTHAQIAALNMDIVWLEEQEVAGQKVLVPVVYIANPQQYRIKGGRIIAGDDINLVVDELNNSGLLQAGRDVNIDATDSITNSSGTIQAGENMVLKAENDIRNISAKIKGRNIALVASNGDIINERYSKEILYHGGSTTMVGEAGSIEATDSLALNAANNITIKGSNLKGDSVSLTAEQIDIGTTVATSNFSGSASGASLKQESLTNLASNVEGGDITIQAAGIATVEGSNIAAERDLNVSAKELNVLAVNDFTYEESKSSQKDLLSSSSTTTKKATSTNIASNLSGGNVSLSTINNLESTATGGDINIVGSTVAAQGTLALDSAGDINVQAGFDGSMDESQTKKSGWFSGGKLFSKSEDLEGKLTKTASKASLSGGNITMNAEENIAMKGVDVSAEERLSATATNIAVENTDNEVKTYSKHEKLDVGFGDALKSITNPLGAIKVKDGKASVTLATAEYEKAETVTTTTTVVGSKLDAKNIDLTANSKIGHAEDGSEVHEEMELASVDGNILIKGSDVAAKESLNLTADNNVTVQEAKNTESTTSKEQKGKAELKATVKNEYVQIGYAIKAAKEAKDNLQKAKSSYSQYKQELSKQRGQLLKLKADLINGRIGIEQADIDEFQELIDDLAEDDAFYKANIVLAAADLATKTLAVVTQMSTAASSSATYGFSASLELDIDMLEKQFEAYKEQSVASNLNADNININAGATATIRGSNVAANDSVNIAARDTNILASQDVNTSSESTDHKHLNISVGTSGATSGSVSMDRSNADSSGLTNTNSQLSGNNITINTDDHTIIRGANIAAADKLKLTTEHLEVTSVQDSQKSKSLSQGFSISGSTDGGVTGGGVNAGNSRSSTREAVLTTLTGGEVDIAVEKDTTLRGALIAAVDGEGNDTGNLKLKTETLEVGSVNSTHNSKSMSMGVNVGLSGDSVSSVGIDYSNDRANSKTKTLGTIGNGTIEIANVDASSTKLLNRDINDNEVDIYNIESHQGLKGTVDTRVFTKDGRNAIAEDFERTERLGQAIGDVATKDAFKLQDTFAHIDETQKDLDVQKAFALANNGKNIEALQGDGTTIEQKQEAIKLYAEIYAKTYGVDIESANVIAASKIIGGTHYGNDGKSTIDINDNAQRNATDYANTMGHEVTHARVSQGKTRDRGDEKLNEEYANTMGGYSADGMEFSAGTYTTVSLDPNKVTNDHTQTTADKKLLTTNNANWRARLKEARNGNGEVDYLLPEIVKEWRDDLNKYMDDNRQASADMKGDAVGTALSIVAAPADILADLANVLITTVDVTTDGLGATGMMGKDLQEEAFQNLMDMGVKADYMIENKEAIAAAVVKGLEEFPGRVAELDPSALRSLTTIALEAGVPVASIAKINKVAKLDAPRLNRADPKDIKFSQPTVSPNYSEGGHTIDSTAKALRNKDITPDDLTPIRVVEVDGKLVTLDNRRLASFEAAGIKDIPIQKVSLKDPKIADEFDRKYRPIDDGTHVVVTPRAGRGAAEKALQDAGKVKNTSAKTPAKQAGKGVSAQTGSLKNASGNTTDMANSARNQPYGDTRKVDVPNTRTPVARQEAFDISYNKHLENGATPQQAARDANQEIDSFQGQIYKEELQKGDVLVVNHTGGEGATGTYAIDINQADKTSEQLQTELALPKANLANAQTKITVEEPQTILSGKAADKSGENWAHDHATGGGEQKVINPAKTNVSEVLQ